MGFRILVLFGFGIVVFKAVANSLKCKCCWQGLHLRSRKSSSLTVGISTHHNPPPPSPPSSHTWEHPSKKCVFLEMMSYNLILTLWCSDGLGDCFSALTSRTWWYINLHSLYHPPFICILSMQSKQVHERANNFSCHSHYMIAQKTLGKSNFVELLPIMSHHFPLRRAGRCILCFLSILQGANKWSPEPFYRQFVKSQLSTHHRNNTISSREQHNGCSRPSLVLRGALYMNSLSAQALKGRSHW